MGSIVCRFADVAVKIEYLSESFPTFVKGYETDETPLLSVGVSQTDIMEERERAKEGARYSDGYLERLVVLRKFAEKVVSYGVLLVHGSAVGEGDNAYLITAPSGVGKSTHARLWRENFPETYALNDDKPFLRVTDGAVFVYGSPWNGKHHLSVNRSACLKSICFLKRGLENSIVAVPQNEATISVLKAVYLPVKEETAQTALALVGKLVNTVSCYSLQANMLSESAKLSHAVMAEGEKI